MPFCPNCGKDVKLGVPFCANCGKPVQAAVAIAPIARPLGVTILGILQLITSIVLLTVGAAVAAFAGSAALVIAPFAIISFLFALAVFTGRNWARILMMIGAVFDILSVIGIIWGAIILWYLTRPRVIAYFKQPKMDLVTALLGRS